MNRFYKFWFLLTLAIIPVFIFVKSQTGKVDDAWSIAPLTASGRNKLMLQRANAAQIGADAKRLASQWAQSAKGAEIVYPLQWIQKTEGPINPVSVIKPVAPPQNNPQRPVQLRPSLPRRYAIIGNRIAHPTRIIARYASRRHAGAPALTVMGKNGSQSFDQDKLQDNGLVTLNALNEKSNEAQPEIPGATAATDDSPQDVFEAVLKGEELITQIKALKETGKFEFVEPDFVITVSATPTDSAFADGRLWGLRNTGQSRGTAGMDINAERAWDVSTGSENVIVAVIDTGIRYTHQDLRGQMWINTDEIAGNGIDDDNDGYIDNIYGIDAVNNDGDPMDDHNHGTHCAGTIGAEANNGHPHVGVAWNVKLMACKFLSSGGWGYTSGAIACVDWAVANGAKVLSNSWGGGGFSQGLHNAISNAHDRGVLFVAAAGNSGQNTDSNPHYPSNYNLDNIISVAAMDRHGNLASWSNYGRQSVDLAAPGVEIYSSTAASDSAYAHYSGTSMACPHVAGVSALLLARHPTSTIAELRQRLLATVAPMDNLREKVASGGRVDAHQALAGGEDGDLELAVTASSNPLRGGTTASLFARVTDLVPITGATVTSTIPGVGNLVFLDDGEAPDLVSGDAIYSVSFTVPTDPNQPTLELEVTAAKTGKNSATAQITLDIIYPPANDYFVDRAVLTGKHHIIFRANTDEATREPGEPSHHYRWNRGGHSLWWSWTARASGPAEINTVGSNFDTILAVYTGNTLNALQRVASDDDGGGNWTSRVTFNATAGTTYQIAVDGYGNRSGDINGEIILVNEVSPENDHFTNAITLDGSQPHAIFHGSNIGATTETSEPSHGGQQAGKSVWWSWTPEVDSQATLSTWAGNGQQNPFWSLLAIYTGDSVASLTPVARGTRQVQFQANAGTTYRIAIDGINWRGDSRPDRGSFRMTLDAEPQPSNDHFVDAKQLNGAQASALTTNIHATKETDEPDHASNRGGKSLWWSWIAPVDGTVKIETTGSTLDTLLGIYTGDSLNNLTLVSGDDNSGDNYTSKTSFAAVAGTTYRIAVDGKYSTRWRWINEGQIKLNLHQVPTIEIAALGEAVDATSFTWLSGGNAHWFSQTDVFNHDGDAAQSGPIGHNEETYISVELTGKASLSFFWKISSEENSDFLKFYIDDVETASISGDIEQILNFEIPAGTHTIAWAYSKDGSVSAGLDRGWLDHVVILPELSVKFTNYHPDKDAEGRKWFTAADGTSYYLTRNGRIYKSTISGDTIIGMVDRHIYDRPQLLVWPSLSNLRHDANRDEPNRKWLSGDSNQWYYIAADGRIYRSTANGDELLGRVDQDRFDNPQLLTQPAVDFIQHLSEIDQPGREWFAGIDGNRYYTIENGGVYRSNADGTVLIGGLNPEYYHNPALLTWPRVTFKEHLADQDKLGRKWLNDISGHTYYITPTGSIFKQAAGDDSHQPFAGTRSDRFANPTLLIKPEVELSEYKPDKNEPDKKWLTDSEENQYYIGPAGDVYSWDSDNSISKLLGGVHPSRFQNPVLLLRPAFAFAEYSAEQDQPGEKWLKDFKGNWYFISPKGSVYRYDEASKAGTLIGGVDISEFIEPQLLIWPTVIFTQHLADQDEAGKKWFRDADGKSYYITPEGRVYKQGASAHSTGDYSLIGSVSKKLFQAANKLVVRSGMFATYHPEWDGESKKWFTDSNNKWHFINELGEICKWSHPNDSFDSYSGDSGMDDDADTNNPTKFTDSSASEHIITGHGNTTHAKTQMKAGDSSMYFDGTGDYLSVPSSSDFGMGTGDFTVEFWVRFDNLGSYHWMIGGASGNTFDVTLYRNGGLTCFFDNGSTSKQFAWNPSSNTWYHVAITRSSGDLKAYIDGTQIGSTLTETYDIPTQGVVFGQQYEGSYQLDGYLDEIRIVKGTAVYTGNFTPPTALTTTGGTYSSETNVEHPTDTQTKLLIHSGRQEAKGPNVVGRLSPVYYYNTTLLTD